TIVAALPTRDVPLPAFAPRPKTDVGAPLVDLASNTGPLVDLSKQGAASVEEVALNVPLPTRRPAYAPPAELVTGPD
ncbi:peptidase M15, partial [Rhizobiaceae sp. 2RAB30]